MYFKALDKVRITRGSAFAYNTETYTGLTDKGSATIFECLNLVAVKRH